MSIVTPSRALAALCLAVTAALATGAMAQAHPTGPVTVSAPTALASCPIRGESVYGDTWGDPRSGGRRHEGVDMEAPRGTPVLAVQAGEAEFKQTSLGGNSIWIVTSTGERYFYAHLDAFEGVSRTVEAGEVIGYVGSTGNARGDHLHFETRLGETAVNPYLLVLAACQPQPVGLRSVEASPPRPQPLLPSRLVMR